MTTRYTIPADLNSAASVTDAIAEIAAGTDRLAVIIMPRNLGPVPGAPRGHSTLFSRADVVAEWEDGAFHIAKRKWVKFRATKCPCGHDICKNWFVEPVAAIQGVGFSEAEAKATADFLNTREAALSIPKKPPEPSA